MSTDDIGSDHEFTDAGPATPLSEGGVKPKETRLVPASVELRAAVAKRLGSFPMHDDDRGPDNTVLIDELPWTPGEGQSGETFLYKLVDAILALLPTPPGVGEGELDAVFSALQNAIALLDVAIAGTVFTKPDAGRVIVNVERAKKVLDGLRAAIALIAASRRGGEG